MKNHMIWYQLQQMHNYPIITEPFIITNEGTFRFYRNSGITYYTGIKQQGVEKLVDDVWVKVSYEETQRIAKLYLKEYKE